MAKATLIDNTYVKVAAQRTSEEIDRNMLNVLYEIGGMLDPLTVSVKTYAADGVADMNYTVHLLGDAVDITGFTPKRVGQVVVVCATASTTDPTCTCGAGVTWEGTNDCATFPDAYDLLLAVAISTTRWLILANVTGVTFS